MSFSTIGQTERRQRVARLLRQGLSETEIAARLGAHRVTVCKDVAALRAEWRASAAQDRDAWIARELGKLEAIEAECWRIVYNDAKGKLFAIDRIIAVMARRAAMLGLDAPTRVNLKATVRGEAERIAKERDLPLDEVLAEVARIIGEAADSA